MDNTKKRPHHKRSKPKRDGNNNNDDAQNLPKKTIRIAGAQMGDTSTDTLVTTGRETESSSSSGHSLTMSSSREKTKHVSFEDVSEKSGSTSSSQQSKSSEMSLHAERSTKSVASTEGGSITPAASKTILKKRQRNARRRAKKMANQAMIALKTEEAAAAAETASTSTAATPRATLMHEPKLKFADDVLQVAERPTGRKAQVKTTSARQRQQDIENAALAPGNIEIAARFQQIMDMFDNFTKNLESLELPPSPRNEVGNKALTKNVRHKQHAIPMGWKGSERNQGSNIEISISEKADKQEEDKVEQASKETSMGLTAVRGLRSAAAQIEEVKIEKPIPCKAEVRAASAVLPTIVQQCEVKNWKTGIAKESEHKCTEEAKDPKTLQAIAKEKLANESKKPQEHMQHVENSDISIHEACVKSTPSLETAQAAAVKAPTASTNVEAINLPATPRVMETAASMQTDQPEHINVQVRACEKDFEVEKNTKPNAAGEAKETTVSAETKPVVNDNTDFVIDIECSNEQPEREEFEIWKMHHNVYPAGLPKWRQGLQNLASAAVKKSNAQEQQTKDAAAIATQIDISTSTAELPRQTVSCQTSLHQNVTATGTTTEIKKTTPAAVVTTAPPPSPVLQHQNLAADSQIDETTSKAETDCKVQTYLIMPPPDENKTCGALGPSISRQALVKESPSLMDLPRVMTITQQPERTFHTIHIDTTSTPSPSVMQRPPLGQRCWTVITDLFNAICVCLQVNKDCIFCLGFFIAFVVSASFLTAFFYRTLSITPQIIHPQQQGPQHVGHLTPVSSRGNTIYYY